MIAKIIILSSTQTTRFMIFDKTISPNLHPSLVYTRILIKSIIWVNVFDKNSIRVKFALCAVCFNANTCSMT